MSLLLKNAVVTDLQSPHHNKKKDIFIKGGIIESFGSVKANRVIDCSGKLVTPGWFDLNAHFCDPGNEFKEDVNTGSSSASHGGFTDVNLLPHTSPPIQTKGDVEYLLTKGSNLIDIHISASVSENLEGENLTEMLDLYHAGARSFSEGDLPIWNTQLLLKALQYTSDAGVPIFQNARDIRLSQHTHMHEGVESTNLGLRGEPTLSEELTIGRDLQILKYAGGRLHFSQVSSAKGVALIKKAKKEGLNVTCDVAIHHLLFTDKSVQDFDSTYKSLPPFRTDTDRKALLKGLKEGVIDAVCSAHRPQDLESKQLEFDLADAGAISLQTFLPSLLSVEEVPFELLIEKITHGPREILGMENVKIDKGSAAKLTIIDKDRKWVLNEESSQSKSKNSPFWEAELTGKVVGTINGEKVLVIEK